MQLGSQSSVGRVDRDESVGVICRAIREQRLLEFEYGGLHRVVAPYCHGVNRQGVEVVRAVQTQGWSRSGGFGFGRLWIVADMKNLVVTDQVFLANDPAYDPRDRAMGRIHCRVA